MLGQGCAPDVVTYTALISSFEKGGQWRLALEAYERMRAQVRRVLALLPHCSACLLACLSLRRPPLPTLALTCTPPPPHSS